MMGRQEASSVVKLQGLAKRTNSAQRFLVIESVRAAPADHLDRFYIRSANLRSISAESESCISIQDEDQGVVH